MTRYLLDSDAVIVYLNSYAPTVSLLRALAERGEVLCTCDVVVAEVYSGLEAEDRNNATEFLQSVLYLDTSQRAAQQAGEWRYTYARRGVTLLVGDALVAATAHEHAATLITGNKRHYPMEEVFLLQLSRA